VEWLRLKEYGMKNAYIKKLMLIFQDFEELFYEENFKLFNDELKSQLEEAMKIDLKARLELYERNRVRIISANDKEYPKKLKEIKDFPVFLYLKGKKLQDYDKIKIDKLVMVPKGVVKTVSDNFVTATDWSGYGDGNYKFLTPQEFLTRIGTDKGFKDIIGNEDHYEENNPKYDVYYTFFLKVEGRQETVLPIMDLKYDDALFLKLLKGETLTLDKNYYIAMGDNTTNSLDSRFFGYVSEDRIKGKLLFRWWPLNRLGLI